jgi:outer membrane protein OmpA-like peptidoglycan-associated protein
MKLSTKNLRQSGLILLFAISINAGFAQGENLVPNGSFEEVTKKPKKLGEIANATGWVSPTGARADLFSSAKVPDIDVPLNVFGKESPKDGDNYAGIVGFSYGSKVPRTYLSTKLSTPLKKGMTYCVKMNVSLAEASKYATNNIGIQLSGKQPGTDSKVSIIEEPSVLHFNNDLKILSGRYNWTEICGAFVAEGGEKFITIGNFDSDEDTKNERMKKDPEVKVDEIAAAYYYIDDVYIALVDKEKGETCDCAAEEANDTYSTTIYQKVFNATDDMTPKDIVEMHQVFFAFGKSKISAQGETSLEIIAEIMKANPEFKLQVTGHNNAKEDEVGLENDYYADMDNKRIGTIVEYLQSKGIDSARLILSTKGSEIPNPEISDADDEDLNEAKNRRVTFKVR